MLKLLALVFLILIIPVAITLFIVWRYIGKKDSNKMS